MRFGGGGSKTRNQRHGHICFNVRIYYIFMINYNYQIHGGSYVFPLGCSNRPPVCAATGNASIWGFAVEFVLYQIRYIIGIPLIRGSDSGQVYGFV